MNEQQYRIKYKRDSLIIEVEGDRDFVERKFAELLDISGYTLDLEETSKQIEMQPITIKQSLSEFYVEKDPTTHDDRVLLFSYWLSTVKQKKEFGRDDILDLYGRVSQSKPKNVTQHLNNNISNGYLDRVDQGIYRINSSGIDYVDNKMDNQG